jgi:hypothetical protein
MHAKYVPSISLPQLFNCGHEALKTREYLKNKDIEYRYPMKSAPISVHLNISLPGLPHHAQGCPGLQIAISKF